MAPAEPLMPLELAEDHQHHLHVPGSRRTAESRPMPLLERGMSRTSARTTESSASGLKARLGLAGVARRTLGIGLLLITVFLWTLSNFLASVSLRSPFVPSLVASSFGFY
jgi:solute carrier family 35 protein F5